MMLRILLAGSAVSITSVYLYARHLHRSLATQIKHTKINAPARRDAYTSGLIECLPVELIERPQDFRIIHVQDEKSGSVSVPQDEQSAGELFTMLLRRNMRAFSLTPQSWILRMIAKTPEQKQSFTKAHIEALNFEEGDIICGFNRVLKRDPLKAELELTPPDGMGSFSGRLVLSLARETDGATLRTQTIQWTEVEKSTTTLPLERGFANFLHETASWHLIVSGVDFLQQETAL